MLKERMIRWSGPTALALVLVGLISGQAKKPSPGVFDQVLARKFILVGPDGDPRGMWRCHGDETHFSLSPKRPSWVVELSARPTYADIRVRHEEAGPSIQLCASNMEVGTYIGFIDKNSRGRLSVNMLKDGTPAIWLADANNNMRASLGGTPLTPRVPESTLTLYGEDGKKTWELNDKNSPLR